MHKVEKYSIELSVKATMYAFGPQSLDKPAIASLWGDRLREFFLRITDLESFEVVLQNLEIINQEEG